MCKQKSVMCKPFLHHVYTVLQERVGRTVLNFIIWDTRHVMQAAPPELGDIKDRYVQVFVFVVVSRELIFSFVSWDLPSHYL